MAEPIEIGDDLAEDIQKHASIGIIEVYRAPGIPSGHQSEGMLSRLRQSTGAEGSHSLGGLAF
ncbi:MAG: hypothetical protein R6U55_02115 [Desulfovermiculus sp.]